VFDLTVSDTKTMNNLFELCCTVVSLYWDYQNVRLPHQAEAFYTFGKSFGKIQTASAYSQWLGKDHPSQVSIYKRGFRLIHIPVNGKNSVDEQLIDDCCCEVTSKVNVLILIAGDKDYIPLVKDLQARGVRIVIVANRYSASRKLLNLVKPEDVYYVDTLAA
jgi:NYN domain